MSRSIKNICYTFTPLGYLNFTFKVFCIYLYLFVIMDSMHHKISLMINLTILYKFIYSTYVQKSRNYIYMQYIVCAGTQK